MKDNHLIAESLRYIKNHLEDALTVAEIAEKVGYSEYYFSRCFRKEVQMSVMEYVKKSRLIKASEELLKGERIIDTALRFGWQTHSGFTKSFKQEFGFCPALLKALSMEKQWLGGNAMTYVFYEKTEVHAAKEQLMERLIKEIENAGFLVEQKEVIRICMAACNVYDGLKRYSGDEYVTHPLNTAIILAQMNADIPVIYAGIFWEAVKKESVSLEALGNMLPKEVMDILYKIKTSNINDSETQDDILLIKLADRLHNMRTIEYLDEEKQKFRAKETLEMITMLPKRDMDEKIRTELLELTLKYLK